MEDVPADYFFWLWTGKPDYQNAKDLTGAAADVAEYIRANLGALEMDHPDGIWR